VAVVANQIELRLSLDVTGEAIAAETVDDIRKSAFADDGAVAETLSSKNSQSRVTAL